MRASPTPGVLTPRDLAILSWIGRYGLVSTAQVAARHFPRTHATHPVSLATSAVYRRLRVLEELKLIQRDRLYLRGPQVIRLTPRGARVAGVRAIPQIVLATVPHTLAVIDLVERLLQENPGAIALTEREIRAQQARARLRHTSQQQERYDTGPWDGNDALARLPLLGRVPDAILCVPTGGIVAVELDRTPKRTVDIARIARAYNRHFPATFTRVWWYARSGRVAERVRATVAHEGYLRVEDTNRGFIEVRAWQT